MPERKAENAGARSPEAIRQGLAMCLSGGGEPVSAEWHRGKVWDRAACLACEMGIGGFLDEETRRAGVSVPDSARAILRAYREHLAAANASKLARLRPVLEALSGADVPCLALKGVALNASLYRRSDVRGMSDVDLLIREADAQRARQALEGRGATPEHEALHPGFFPRFYYEQPFLTADRPPLRIDLHVRPFRPILFRGTVPREAMWLAPRRIELDGCTALTPGREETLIHLCVHAAGHGLEKLRWLYDVLYFLREHGEDLDVEKVTGWSRAWRLSYAVRRTLHSLERVFHRVPPCVRAMLYRLPLRAGWRERLAIHQAPHDAEHPMRHVLVDVLCLRGLVDRAAYLSMHLRPSDAHLRTVRGRGGIGWRWVAQGRRVLRAAARAI